MVNILLFKPQSTLDQHTSITRAPSPLQVGIFDALRPQFPRLAFLIFILVDIGEAIVMEESFQTLHLVRHWRQGHFQYLIHYHFLILTHPCNDPQSLTLSQVLQLPLSPIRLWEMKPSLSAQICYSPIPVETYLVTMLFSFSHNYVYFL